MASVDGQFQIYVSVITGFESIVDGEAVDKEIAVGGKCKCDRGNVRFAVEHNNIPNVLRMHSIDNAFVVVFDQTIHGLCHMDKAEALLTIQRQLPAIDWKKGIQAWQFAFNKQIEGGNLLKSQILCYMSNGLRATPVEGAPKFRVTCHRAGEKEIHKFSSMDAAWALGSEINNVFGWKADMKNYDVEVVLRVRSDQVTVMIALNEMSLFKRNIIAFGPTTMRSTMCYGLLTIGRTNPGDVVLDALCGGGSIPLEGALSFPGRVFIGGDYHPLALERCGQNMAQNSGGLRTSGSSLDFCQLDATRLPLRTNSVDVIVTDLPFGEKIGSKADNRVLYPALLEEWKRVVRPGGKVVVLTRDKRSWDRMRLGTWTPMGKHRVNVGGQPAMCAKVINDKPA